MDTKLPPLQDFVLEIIKELRLERKSFFCGVKLHKVVAIVKQSPYSFNEFRSVISELLDNEVIIITGHVGTYAFGFGSHSERRMLSNDFPDWFDFDKIDFCLDNEDQQYDSSHPDNWGEMSGEEMRQWRRTRPDHRSFSNFKIYIRKDSMPKKVEKILSRGTLNTANAILKKMQAREV